MLLAPTFQTIEYINLLPVRCTDMISLTYYSIIVLQDSHSWQDPINGVGKGTIMHYAPVVIVNLEGVNLV